MKNNGLIKRKKVFITPKACVLCEKGVLNVDYKDVELLSKFISYNGKILPRRVTGLCTKHQRYVTNAIKQARIIALLPFVKE